MSRHVCLCTIIIRSAALYAGASECNVDVECDIFCSVDNFQLEMFRLVFTCMASLCSLKAVVEALGRAPAEDRGSVVSGQICHKDV